MFFPNIISFCLALSGASLIAASPNYFANIPPSKSLIWHPCVADNFFCALMDVPLNYSKPSGSRAYVPWIKYSAITGPYKGIVITNPGGPGFSGVENFLSVAQLGQSIVGTNYDVASFDPRGIGSSIPLANCSAPVAGSTTPYQRRYVDQLHGPGFDPQYVSTTYQNSQALGQRCQRTIGGDQAAGPYMNSGVVARDIVSFLDAYTNSTYSQGAMSPNLFNYWGFSYGTYIGQVFANMFPDRVGRLVLDAVIDADANLAGHELSPAYADEAFSTFFIYCQIAGASQCPYYSGSSANDILARFEATVTKLNPTYAKSRGWPNATVIELMLEAVKTYSFESAYNPIPLSAFPAPNFPNLATFLVDVEDATQNLTMAAYQQLDTKYGLNAPLILPEWAPAVQCTDNGNILNGRLLLSFLPALALYELQSYILGEAAMTLQLRCAGWSIVGDGRYPGPFGGPTKNPILFVSNTRDPALPIQNGEKGAEIYSGAQLLTVDGTGHTSISTFNQCAFGKIGTYFQTGALPGSDNVCPLETGPFNVMATETELKKRGLEEIQKRVKDLILTKRER